MNFHSPPLARPIKLTISYTHSCNLDCRICYANCARAASERELPAATWKRIVDDAIASGVMSIMFEGGEPLHRADFIDLLAHCASRAMTRLRTNATLIDAAKAQALKAANLGDALVDILGAEATTHDALTGAPGSHARLLAGVAALREAGIPFTFLTIMNRRNVGELDGILALGRALGAEAVGVLRPYPLGRMKENWDELSLSLPEMMAAIRGLHVPDGIRLMQSWHPNDANCCWQMAAANAYGDSIGCTYLREYVNYGNLATTPLLETWDDPLYRTLRAGEVTQSCGQCSKTQGSHGGCRSTAFAFHGRWDAPDPFDEPLNGGIDLRILPEHLRALPTR
jgi:radical SAM protein with 4Fe4S-binding SPASM domain